MADPSIAGAIATPIDMLKNNAPIATPRSRFGMAHWITRVFIVGMEPNPIPPMIAADPQMSGVSNRRDHA